MRVKTVTITTRLLELDDGRRYEVTGEPVDDSIIVSEDGLTVGYLAYDLSSENPFDDFDGYGQVRLRRRDEAPEDLPKYAVVLDIYRHSGESWSVSGEGYQCRFDTARGAGVWEPDDECRHHIESFPPEARAEAAVKRAREACELFNQWLSGDCYVIFIETYAAVPAGKSAAEPVTVDSCGGYFGFDSARAALAEQLAATAKV